MESGMFWQLFMETGAPEMYMLYHKAKRTEDAHVSDDTGTRSAGHTIQ